MCVYSCCLWPLRYVYATCTNGKHTRDDAARTRIRMRTTRENRRWLCDYLPCRGKMWAFWPIRGGERRGEVLGIDVQLLFGIHKNCFNSTKTILKQQILCVTHKMCSLRAIFPLPAFLFAVSCYFYAFYFSFFSSAWFSG